MKRLILKIQFLIAGIYIWLRMGIPFTEAMQSMREAEEIMEDSQDLHGL